MMGERARTRFDDDGKERRFKLSEYIFPETNLDGVGSGLPTKKQRQTNMPTKKNKGKDVRRFEKDAPIAIVGCGIAGLSTAISLTQAGFSNVSIFERDASVSARREGFGMTLSYNPKGPLAQLGILEDVAQQDCPSRSHYVFSQDGSVLGYYGNAFSSSTRGVGQRGNLRVPRQKLRTIMIEKFLRLTREKKISSRIFWGHSLINLSEVENTDGEVGVKLTFLCNQSVPGGNDGTHGITYIATFDFVVAADGVHSAVVSNLVPQCKPSPLNVGIVLGISEGFDHALLNERGFYTIDGKHRLFIMPYEGDRYSKSRRVMWQLSYSYDENKDESPASHGDPEFLKKMVLEICSSWHEPVSALIEATPLETTWGTHLVDRDPRALQAAFQKFRRIVVLGDALHGMSPFKGQGANQALQDGPLVSNSLQVSRRDAAVRTIWREAVQRTEKIVMASRKAAHFWHSPCSLPAINEDKKSQQDEEQTCGFAGVKAGSYDLLFSVLRQRKISANLADNLDSSIRDVIEELQIREPSSCENPESFRHLYPRILDSAAQGQTENLRKLSLIHAPTIRLARNENGQSSLHLAVCNRHYQTCRWLLTEASMDPLAEVDFGGKSPLDYASDAAIAVLLQTVVNHRR